MGRRRRTNIVRLSDLLERGVKVLRNAGLWAAVIMFLFSAVFLWQSLKLDYKGPLGVGPGFFPFWLSLILIILSILYLLNAIKHVVSIHSIFPKNKALGEFLVIIGSMVLFVLLLEPIGFVAASALALIVLLYRSFTWYMSLLLSVGISVIIFLIFAKALDVPLPVNSFGW
jgi:putative tricarboxylic transport membrane protein